MNEQLTIKRTDSNDEDFNKLIKQLDEELWNIMNEDQATYDQYNKVPDISTVIVAYNKNMPVGCGCFKKYDDNTVEIKRMFVVPESRGKGVAIAVLDELETWAKELKFTKTILETGKRMHSANNLYRKSGYSITENYGPYIGMDESVCMKKELNEKASFEFRGLSGIEYFDFEEDFIEENVRCISMVVRFKMDSAGIKLKLSEWSRFNIEERIEFALKACGNKEEKETYKNRLSTLVFKYTGMEATPLKVESHPLWADLEKINEELQAKAQEFKWKISIEQWKGLTNLQRFVLLKLCKPGHENKNFPKAMKEFNLI